MKHRERCDAAILGEFFGNVPPEGPQGKAAWGRAAETIACILAYRNAGLGIRARMKADFLRANPIWALSDETIRRFNDWRP